MSAPGNDSVVERAWARLHLSQVARQTLVSSLRCVLMFALLFADMNYGLVSGPLHMNHPMLWFVELAIGALLLFQIATNSLFLCGYFWHYFCSKAVNVTDEQRRLMAIPDGDKSFCTPPKKMPSSATSTPLTFSAGDSSQFLSRTRSPNMSYSPSFHSPNVGGSPHQSFLSISPPRSSFNTSLNNTSLDKSLNLSQSFRSPEYDRTSLRSRRSASLPVSSRSSKYKYITDLDTLNRYILEEEERELNKSQASPENLSASTNSFWNYASNPLDLTHILRRFVYQIAPRSTASLTLRSSSDQANSPGGCRTDDVWRKYGVSEDSLYAWTEKLRKWLSFTIISKLEGEIEGINAKITKVNPDDKIGKVGLSTINALSKQRQDLSTLPAVLPFLEVTANQEYLSSRIKDLSTGSMSAFTWNKGGNYGKAWSEHLPTDAALVMHMFCCYLDARLPVQPNYPDGKPFTSQHFLKTPDKPSSDKKDAFQIFQSSINPPHFQVLIGSETLNLAKGRNNMFQAILLFLYHVKTKECGMLGRINLGMSGLNILWIFD